MAVNRSNERAAAEAASRQSTPKPTLLFPPTHTVPRLSFPYTDLHESDTATIAISFVVDGVSDLTSPGLALGVGQKVNINQNLGSLELDFDLTNGQFINLSEVCSLTTSKLWCERRKQRMRLRLNPSFGLHNSREGEFGQRSSPLVACEQQKGGDLLCPWLPRATFATLTVGVL